MYKIRYDYFNDNDVVDGKNVYPGFKDIYDVFELFYSKIKHEDCDSDCDSDSDIEIVFPDSDSDSDSDSF